MGDELQSSVKILFFVLISDKSHESVFLSMFLCAREFIGAL